METTLMVLLFLVLLFCLGVGYLKYTGKTWSYESGRNHLNPDGTKKML